MRAGQVTVEFTLIMVFMMLLSATLFVALDSRIAQLQDEKNVDVMSQLANVVYTEISLAAMVGHGYEREFYIPIMLNGQNYTVEINQKWDLVVRHEQLEYITFFDVPVTGSVQKGTNTVTNRGGTVFLNT